MGALCACLYLPIRPMFPYRCLVCGDLFEKYFRVDFYGWVCVFVLRFDYCTGPSTSPPTRFDWPPAKNVCVFFLFFRYFLFCWVRDSYGWANLYSPRSTSSMVGSNSFSSSVGKKLWFLQFSATKSKEIFPKYWMHTSNRMRCDERRLPYFL